MKLESASAYEKYVILSNYTKMFLGTYPNFLKLQELMRSLNQMVSKNSNTFSYNGELYVSRLTGPEGPSTGQDVTGVPKYYAMFGGATGLTDSTSGGFYLAPTPDQNYFFRIYYNKLPTGLSGSNATTLSLIHI